MQQALRFFQFLLKVFVFFTLLAFALNNQHHVTVRFFFNQQWTAPLALIIFCILGIGLLIGALTMLAHGRQKRSMMRTRNDTTNAYSPLSQKAAESPPHD